MWKPVILLLIATPFLGACERYTEQTSPCFGRNGEPVVSRAAFSSAAGKAIAAADPSTAAKDCNFEELSRPV